ncbi:uncharacterized protein (DUF1778 family) [Neisseria sp. HSC-16F19]|nr:DUF1778 domain-containing protein [Neisseria sp. HSC-16F19]MCP2041081.1 uncharacterized protein (DUF1778 family) [Neisseria sp. HSC-16F19]
MHTSIKQARAAQKDFLCPVSDETTAKRILFQLDKATFIQFAAALEQLPAHNPGLNKLLQTHEPWAK